MISKKLQSKQKRNKGMTMIELIIAIAIISILAGGITLALIKYIEKARAVKDMENCETLKKSLSNHVVDGGFDLVVIEEDGTIRVTNEKMENAVAKASMKQGSFVRTSTGASIDYSMNKNANDFSNSKDVLMIGGTITEGGFMTMASTTIDSDDETIEYKEGEYYIITDDDGRKYTKRYPHQGATKSKFNDNTYDLWYKYQDDGYKDLHPLNDESTYDDYKRCADPEYVIWYEKTTCEYKWLHNMDDEGTKEDYPGETDQKHPDDIDEPGDTSEDEELGNTNSAETSSDDNNTSLATGAPSDNNDTSSTAQTPEVSAPSSPQGDSSGNGTGAVTITPSADPRYINIGVYEGHMEVYNTSGIEYSRTFLETISCDENYSGIFHYLEAAGTIDVDCKSRKSSYVLKADYSKGELVYTVYLSGTLAKYADLFEGIGEVVIVE